MSKLIEIGNCLVDVSMIIAVEPYSYGYQEKYTGAKVILSNSTIIHENRFTFREVKELILKSRESIE